MKKIFKKVMSIVLVLMMLPLASINVSADETYQHGYMEYTISEDNEITITNVITGGKQIIPSEINGLPVTTIGRYAFSDSNVEEVFIPNSVLTIDYGAFYGCSSLKKVTIEEPVVYSENHISGLTLIGERAFFACESLEEIVLPTVSIIDEEAFSKCHSLRYVVLPYGVREIRDYAFSYCPELRRLVIPESIWRLDKSVYAYSGIVNSPDIVYSCLYYGGNELVWTDNHQLDIHPYAYEENYCYLDYEYPELWEFVVTPEKYSDGIVERICCCGNKKTKSVPKLSDIIWKRTYNAPTCVENGMETYTSSYGEVSNVIPATGKHTWGTPTIVQVENAAEDYIYTCSVCEEKMTERKWEFEYAYADQTMETIEIIGLKDSGTYSGILRIPSEIDGYKVISIYELPDINHITKVEVGENVEKIYEGAFSGSLNIQAITLPDTIEYISDHAFENCISLKEINIPDSVTYLGKEAFKNCTNLRNIEIPGSVENILESTFYGCENLETVILNEGIISIGNAAFASCINVDRVSLPNGLTKIESLAFSNCKALKQLSIPESVLNIDSLCFSGSGIEYFRLPSSLINFSVLPGYVFSGCSDCKGVYVDENNPSFLSDGNGVVYSKDMTKLLYYPSGSKMTEYIVPDGIKEISGAAFGGDSSAAPPLHSLQKITLPKSLEKIGAAAFWASSGLETVVYKGTEIEYAQINVASYGNDSLNNSTKVFEEPEEVKEVVSTPTASVAPGNINQGTTLILSTETENATIYYTTDGSIPTTSSLRYTQSITINANTTIKAYAVKNGMEDSAIATYTYTVINDSNTTVSVSNGKGRAGDTVTLTLDVANNTGIAGMILRLSYDEGLTLTNISTGDALSGLTFTPPANVSKNPCTLLWDGITADSTNGTVLTLTFKINDTASEGEYKVNVSHTAGDIYDDNTQDIDVQIVNGSVTVRKYKTGDVNEDDVINAKDITMLRKFISGDYGVTINEDAADVNKDGVLNAKDITILRKYISGDYGIVLD